MHRNKPGPRPKGDRRAITVRVPKDDWDLYDATYKANGFDSLSDYVAALLAAHHNLDVPSWIQKPHPRQEVLPLLKAG